MYSWMRNGKEKPPKKAKLVGMRHTSNFCHSLGRSSVSCAGLMTPNDAAAVSNRTVAKYHRVIGGNERNHSSGDAPAPTFLTIVWVGFEIFECAGTHSNLVFADLGRLRHRGSGRFSNRAELSSRPRLDLTFEMIDLEVAGHALYSTPGNAPYTIFVICVQQPAQSWSVYRSVCRSAPARPRLPDPPACRH